MKQLKLIMLFCIGALFIASKSFGQANPYISVLPSNSGIVEVGATIDIIVTIGNTGPNSTIPQAKLRPIIQVPSSVTFLPNAQQVGLPAGWTILTNTGSQLRLCNSADPIPVSSFRTITLKVQGVTVTPAQTFAGNINFGNGTTCSAGTSVAGDLTIDNSALSTIQVVAPPIATINLKCFIQGYYINDINDANYQKMRPAVFNQIGAPFTATDCDTLTVELHDATFPYAIATGVPAFVGVMNTDGVLACTFPAAAVGGNYYIAVKHRNALQTWSANPVTIAAVTPYDFTNLSTPGPDTKSYGPNQFEVEPGIWAFISGDITDDGSSDNQDGAVDGFDYTKLDPLVINGDCGYYGADLNGDGCVDAFDYILMDPNIILGYTMVLP